MRQPVVRQFAAREQRVDQLEAGRRAVAHRHGDRAVQLDDRRRLEPRAARRRGRRSRAQSVAAALGRLRHAPPRSPPEACRDRSAATASARSTSAAPSSNLSRDPTASDPDRRAGSSSPVRRGARGAPRFVQQHQRQQSHAPRVPAAIRRAAAPGGSPRADRSCRVSDRAGRRRIALVEHEVDHAQHRVEPLGQLGAAPAPRRECARRGSWPWRARCAAPAWAPASGRRARSPRWSGRRPRAASAPPARRGASAGWQQVKIRRSRSSSTLSPSVHGAASLGDSVVRARASSDASKRARRRMPSMALKRPADTSQARGLAGTPSRGHCSSAARNASCSASSARSKSPSRRISVASTARDSERYTASTVSRARVLPPIGRKYRPVASVGRPGRMG